MDNNNNNINFDNTCIHIDDISSVAEVKNNNNNTDNSNNVNDIIDKITKLMQNGQSNIPKTVLDKIGRNLHLVANHPISIIKNLVTKYFIQHYSTINRKL